MTVQNNPKKAAGTRKRMKKSPVEALVNKVHGRCGLNLREALFVDGYIATLNVEQAYIEAGFAAKPGASAQSAGSRLLNMVKCRAYLAQQTKAVFRRLEQEQDNLIRVLTYTAYADPRELVEHWRHACRYCHGKLHRYQFTSGEWDKKMTEFADKQEKAAENGTPAPKAPDSKGGVGFNPKAEPNDDCPECGGIGVGKTVVKDTRNLSPAAVALYAGTKEGKDGIEIKMHDQMKAREMLAKLRKLYDDSTTVNVNIDAAELDALYGEAMRKGAERMASMRSERLAHREAREQGFGAIGFVPSKAIA